MGSTNSQARITDSTQIKPSVSGFIIALGVVYGDIGTSPLYVMKSIIGGNGGLASIDTNFILGSLSLIFWTVTIITSCKYVGIALRADNHGEGGIFALYTLVRKRAKWLIIPAMVGGSTFLADGMMTPAVTVTTSIEGLKGVKIGSGVPISNQGQVIIVTMIILSFLFFIQRFGTEILGKSFGPIMLVWFTFIGAMGLKNLSMDWSMLRAINPYYAVRLLFSPANKEGIFILGSVFLATTGAEALYSDMGHVGRNNIYVSWPYVFVCLMLSYLGQAAWINQIRVDPSYQAMGSALNPFFMSIPASFRLPATFLSTAASIIASQALISGSFTLVSEATKLKMFPRLKTYYPTNFKGQLYIPVVNTVIWIVCLFLVLYFKTSNRLSEAYGLEITITMLMTSILLLQWLLSKPNLNKIVSRLIMGFFFTIEIIFLITNSTKFVHGAYVTMAIALILIFIMFTWSYGGILKEGSNYKTNFVSLLAYKKQLHDLRDDEHYPMFATNLVYLTKVKDGHKVSKDIMYSILDKNPKRAKVYWFVTVNVTDEPYTESYSVDTYGTDYIVNVQLYLGFRVDQKVNIFLRQIVNELMNNGDIKSQPQKYTTIPDRNVGDFEFVLIKQILSPETQISGFNKLVIQTRLKLQKFISPATWFGLSYSDVIEERVPLVLGKVRVAHYKLSRVDKHEVKNFKIDKEINVFEEEEEEEEKEYVDNKKDEITKDRDSTKNDNEDK